MALSNADGHLVLATGNKSELGRWLLDHLRRRGRRLRADQGRAQDRSCGSLRRWRNAQAEAAGMEPPIPQNSIDKPPSAELRPDQLDSDSLPDYELLDAVLARYVDGDEGFDQIVAEGFDPELVTRVARMVDTAEWKRRQYPPGPKISFKAFGRDRRLPITSRWREHALDATG